MTAWERWLLHLGTWLVGGTGLVYAGMLYLLPPVDEFSVVHHPLQGTVQHLHVLAAPLLVFAVGLIFRDHAWAGFRRASRPGRGTGIVLLASFAPLVASGYLLQTSTDDSWRRGWVAVHLLTGGLWLAGYAGHWWTRRRTRRVPGDQVPT